MKNKTKHSLIIGFAILVGVIGQTTFISTASAAPVAVQSYGATYGELSARWWQWVFSIPAEINPLLDVTGANCAQKQYDDVWFLAGNFGGDVTRSCTIPAGKPIFFPLINNVAFKPTGKDTLLDLRHLAGEFIDTVSGLEVIIDGNAIINNFSSFRVKSPSFTVIVPANALVPRGKFSAPSNADSLVSDGYWLLLEPLPVGNHTITFHAETSNSFELNVTYNVTVN